MYKQCSLEYKTPSAICQQVINNKKAYPLQSFVQMKWNNNGYVRPAAMLI